MGGGLGSGVVNEYVLPYWTCFILNKNFVFDSSVHIFFFFLATVAMLLSVFLN